MRKLRIIPILLFMSVVAMAQKEHVVKQGESMESIAKQYATTVAELQKLNPSAEILFPGLVLNIPPKTIIKEKGTQKQPTSSTLKIDRIEMTDGSYILCQVIAVRQTTIAIKQDGIVGSLTVPIKDVILIDYANGTKKRFRR